MHAFLTLAGLRRRTGLASLVLLGVACRALIPVGFMPAAIADGGPIAVCHGGLAGEFFRRLALETHDDAVVTVAAEHAGHAAGSGHNAHAARDAGDPHGDAHSHHANGDGSGLAAPHAHDDAADASHEAWEHCPVGAAFAAALVSAEFDLTLLDLEHAFEAREPALPVHLSVLSSYRARAPPAHSLHS